MLKIDISHFRYKSDPKTIIEKVAFMVGKGQVVAVLGPSGCGKTTLLNLVAGLLSKTEAAFEGGVVFGKKTPIMATVFQEDRLLPWKTARENVAFSLVALGESRGKALLKAGEILSKLGLAEYGGHYPRELSVGMKQRVNLARALVVDPDILFLDEPFSALDHATKTTVQEEFKKAIKEKELTCVFVTHNEAEAFVLADTIVRLSKRPSMVLEVKENRGARRV